MVVIRDEEPADRDGSVRVVRAAFGSDEEAEIVHAVRDLAGSFALVAVDGGHVIGHVQMSRAWIGETDVLSLGPIGVQPSRQGEGVGSRLVRASLEVSADRGEVAVMLLGAPSYYGRFGFVPGSTFGLANPFAGVDEGDFVVREEDFQVAVLADPLPGFVGAVRWHPAFGQAG
jgi:predicted N-acetyltransferase YhbS